MIPLLINLVCGLFIVPGLTALWVRRRMGDGARKSVTRVLQIAIIAVGIIGLINATVFFASM
jgi:hypothetical protein